MGLEAKKKELRKRGKRNPKKRRKKEEEEEEEKKERKFDFCPSATCRRRRLRSRLRVVVIGCFPYI